ncbi:MAG: flagellar hook-basal body complex protein FliE [Thermoleophilia bacterium]|jgi:flagellar hook-basal body complex protein FliE|nr:flagellar hook-basal body complex protein FliE [Thermoleophilia bacterium]
MSPLPPIQPLTALPAMPGGPGAIDPSAAARAAEGPRGVEGAAGVGGFGDLLGQAIGRLNTDLGTSAALQRGVATGQVDPTDAIVQTQMASIELQLAVQVRNKLVEGWQELSRMSV